VGAPQKLTAAAPRRERERGAEREREEESNQLPKVGDIIFGKGDWKGSRRTKNVFQNASICVTGKSYPQLHICMAGTYRFRLRVCACEREWGQGGALFVDKRGTRERKRERAGSANAAKQRKSLNKNLPITITSSLSLSLAIRLYFLYCIISLSLASHSSARIFSRSTLLNSPAATCSCVVHLFIHWALFPISVGGI